MNILILGTGKVEQYFINLCLKSKLLDKLYTASSEPLHNIPNIEYNNADELYNKAKTLQIDIVLAFDKKYVEAGIVDFLKNKFLNTISVNKKWVNLQTSRLIAKQLLSYYSINIPKTIKAPNAFPLVIKTNKPKLTKILYSMSDLVELRKEFFGEELFLEEYLEGDVLYTLFLWDKKNLLNFNPKNKLTEVQEDRLKLLETKLQFLLSDEKADFMGFFVLKLIWTKNDWYVIDCDMEIKEKYDLEVIDKDFLYLLNATIYQKLNELN